MYHHCGVGRGKFASLHPVNSSLCRGQDLDTRQLYLSCLGTVRHTYSHASEWKNLERRLETLSVSSFSGWINFWLVTHCV